MNNLTKIGILLQVPNLFILFILGLIFIVPYLTVSIVLWTILGVVYGLINITSFILIISGILSNGKN
jgi:hypothetical protein